MARFTEGRVGNKRNGFLEQTMINFLNNHYLNPLGK